MLSCDLPDASVHRILQARILEWVAIPFSRGSSQPRDRTQVSRIAGYSLLSEPPGKPKTTGVGILSLLQGIVPSQESNQGLLHCSWILYQLSYQGSPIKTRCYFIYVINFPKNMLSVFHTFYLLYYSLTSSAKHSRTCSLYNMTINSSPVRQFAR